MVAGPGGEPNASRLLSAARPYRDCRRSVELASRRPFQTREGNLAQRAARSSSWVGGIETVMEPLTMTVFAIRVPSTTAV